MELQIMFGLKQIFPVRFCSRSVFFQYLHFKINTVGSKTDTLLKLLSVLLSGHFLGLNL